MSRDTIRCTEPELYIAQAPGLSFVEGRAVLLGKYTEKELNPQLESIVREHLSRCVCCTEFVKQLEDVNEFRVEDTSIIYASCPSSENLDRYVFESSELSGNERQRIEEHLRDCSLCKEETAWLQGTVGQRPATFRNLLSPERSWLSYVSIAAALLFMALSAFLIFQRVAVRNTEERLRAAAVIKAPDQIDYEALRGSSVSLPEKMTVVYEKGVESLKLGRFQEAIRHLELVTTAHPDHSGSLFLLGYSYYRMNEPERAFELCDRAEKIYPRSLERCLTLVNIALKTGHFGRAIREISGLHHVAPDHPAVKETYDRITAITRGRVVKL